MPAAGVIAATFVCLLDVIKMRFQVHCLEALATSGDKGVIAATFVCPLDVIKTRFQVHGLTALDTNGDKGESNFHFPRKHCLTRKAARGPKICAGVWNIASDEKHHEIAYTKIVEKLFEIDPKGTVLAFADTIKKKISMPVHHGTVLAFADTMKKKISMPVLLKYDEHDDNLFEHFSVVAQSLSVYTMKDYVDTVEFPVGRRNVDDLTDLFGEGRRAQNFVRSLTSRFRRLEERSLERAKQAPPVSFSWIYYRKVQV